MITAPAGGRAALYVRVSSDDQARGWSPSSQLTRLEAFCAEKGWTMVAVYKDLDDTGMDTDRAAYQRMLREKSKWDVCVAIRPDRWHRSDKNMQEFVDAMRVANKKIWSVEGGRIGGYKPGGGWIGEKVTTGLVPESESRTLSDRVLPVRTDENEDIVEFVSGGKTRGKEQGVPQGRMPLGLRGDRETHAFVATKWAN